MGRLHLHMEFQDWNGAPIARWDTSTHPFELRPGLQWHWRPWAGQPAVRAVTFGGPFQPTIVATVCDEEHGIVQGEVVENPREVAGLVAGCTHPDTQYCGACWP